MTFTQHNTRHFLQEIFVIAMSHFWILLTMRNVPLDLSTQKKHELQMVKKCRKTKRISKNGVGGETIAHFSPSL